MKRRKQAKKRIRRVLLIELGLVLIVCTATYALTAGVTLPAMAAGDATTTFTHVHVTSMSFTLDSNDPRRINSVTLSFTGGAPIANARVLIGGGANWSNTCVGGGPWTCSWGAGPSMTGFVANATMRVQVHS